MLKCLFFISLFISPFTLARACETRALMYAAASSANVPADFVSISLDAAKAILLNEITQSCEWSKPHHVNWETWTENPMSYGRQRFWLRGHFNCISTQPPSMAHI